MWISIWKKTVSRRPHFSQNSGQPNILFGYMEIQIENFPYFLRQQAFLGQHKVLFEHMSTAFKTTDNSPPNYPINAATTNCTPIKKPQTLSYLRFHITLRSTCSKPVPEVLQTRPACTLFQSSTYPVCPDRIRRCKLLHLSVCSQQDQTYPKSTCPK